jgi:DNA-binding MarR family transcriptional regulator
MSTRRTAVRHNSLVVEIRRFIAAAIFFNQKVAERFHLNLTDTQCLNVLELSGSATPGQLAEQTGLTTGGITVVLDRLEKAGFVKREPNPDDRRSLIIRPVPAGMSRMQAMYGEISKGLDELFAGYNQKELELILGFFQKANNKRGQRTAGDR